MLVKNAAPCGTLSYDGDTLCIFLIFFSSTFKLGIVRELKIVFIMWVLLAGQVSFCWVGGGQGVTSRGTPRTSAFYIRTQKVKNLVVSKLFEIANRNWLSHPNSQFSIFEHI
jgi:hypothetical protein